MLTMPRTTSSLRDDVLIRMASAFAAGLFAGAALGVLLAPASGRQSREWVLSHGRDVGRRVTPLFHPHEVSAIIRARGVRGLWEVLQHRSGQGELRTDTTTASGGEPREPPYGAP